MHIILITKSGHGDTGVGRYGEALANSLKMSGHEVTFVHPVVPFPAWVTRFARRRLNWDLEAFFYNYPVWINYPPADIYHLTSQNLATLMLFRRPPGKTVLTIHDIIPWLTRNDPELRVYRHHLEAFFDRLAMRGMQKVDAIVADSDFTRESLIRTLRLAPKDIITVPLATQ